jgi:hypothetical protein
MPPCNRVQGLIFAEELGVGAVVVADPDVIEDPTPFTKDDLADSGADSGSVSCVDSGAGLYPGVAHVDALSSLPSPEVGLEAGPDTVLGAAAAD